MRATPHPKEMAMTPMNLSTAQKRRMLRAYLEKTRWQMAAATAAHRLGEATELGGKVALLERLIARLDGPADGPVSPPDGRDLDAA